MKFATLLYTIASATCFALSNDNYSNLFGLSSNGEKILRSSSFITPAAAAVAAGASPALATPAAAAASAANAAATAAALRYPGSPALAAATGLTPAEQAAAAARGAAVSPLANPIY